MRSELDRIEFLVSREVSFNTIILHSALMAYRRAERDPAEVRIARAKELLSKHDCADAACYGITLGKFPAVCLT